MHDIDITYIYVMDYYSSDIYEIILSQIDEDFDMEIVLQEHGFDIDECNYMLTNKRITTIKPA